MKKLIFTLLAVMLIITGCATNNQEEVQPEAPIEEEIVGGWEERVDQEVTEELLNIFNKGVAGTEYEGWVPTKLLATQVVAGTNFKFLCENGKELVIYQDLNRLYYALNEDGSVAEKKAVSTVMLTKEEALDIALKDAGIEEVRFVEISLDKERENTVYEVDFEAGEYEYEYDIDAFSGGIVSRTSELDEDHFIFRDRRENSSVIKGVIDNAAVKEIVFADAAVSEADVQHLRIEKDYDDGVKEIDVEFFANGAEYSYSLNAETGEIIEKEIENH